MARVQPDTNDKNRPQRKPWGGNKASHNRAERRQQHRDQTHKYLSSPFINLGKSDTPVQYSPSHIYGAHVAQQVRHVLGTTELQQAKDDTKLQSNILRELKLKEIAESFLTVVPTEFVTTLLKVLGLNEHIGQMKTNRRSLLDTSFKPLKDSFRRFLDREKTQLNDKWLAVTARIKEELKTRPQQRMFTKDVSERFLRQVRQTWTNNKSDKQLSA